MAKNSIDFFKLDWNYYLLFQPKSLLETCIIPGVDQSGRKKVTSFELKPNIMAEIYEKYLGTLKYR